LPDTCPRGVTTPAPGFSSGTILDTEPCAAVDGNAMIGLPPRTMANVDALFAARGVLLLEVDSRKDMS